LVAEDEQAVFEAARAVEQQRRVVEVELVLGERLDHIDRRVGFGNSALSEPPPGLSEIGGAFSVAFGLRQIEVPVEVHVEV
jgi:hypothetical protein